MTDAPRWRGWRALAWLWLVVVLAVGVHQWRFWHESRLDSDVLALLPHDAHDPALADATQRIADASARNIVVLLGAADAAQARAAAEAYRASLRAAQAAKPLPFAETASVEGWFDATREFYRPWRDRLLTDGQRARLRDTAPDALAEDALAALYGPMGSPRMTQWREDPLNLWPQWWQAQAAASGMRFDADGLLQADDKTGHARTWAVLQFETRGSAFRLDGERVIDAALDDAYAAASKAVPDLRELRAGVPLHAEAAAVQASREVNIIGFGSLAAVLLLVWLAFRSLTPIVLVALSLLVGVAAALSVTAMVFGQVHLLTLVFGASLVGVAEDYGIHWFASRQGHPRVGRWTLLRSLLPGMALAWLTSALAYLALGLAPFPGLQQMAVFSAVGLGAAFLTVLCWFPWLDRGQVRPSALSRAMQAWMSRWPRVRPAARWWIAAAVAAVVAVGGLWQLRSNDDLRNLQSSPKALIDQQIEISRLLALPSPAQFYLVRANDTETLLQREQKLTARLSSLAREGRIHGYRAISDWLPSQRQQATDAAMTARAETVVLARVGAATGEQFARPAFASAPLTLDAWMASPASQPLRPLWLGRSGDGVASVVMVDAPGGDDAARSAGHAGPRPGRRALGQPHRRILQSAGPLPPDDDGAAAGRRGAGVRIAVGALSPRRLAGDAADGAGGTAVGRAARLARRAAATVQRAGAAVAAGHGHRLRHLPARTPRRCLGLAGGQRRCGQHLAVVRPAGAVGDAGAACVRPDPVVRHRPGVAAVAALSSTCTGRP